MSLEACRVGVRNDQVDSYGRVNPNSDFITNLLNDLPAWTDLPVWKKGTEQLLPVNDDEPDTSPILCDIEYPVADLKNNQYFTYRQSPTQKDGKAKIRGIRGKTLVWNQLTQYGDFSSKTGYSAGGGTFAVASNEGTLTLTGSNSYLYRSLAFTTGHKVLVKVDAKTSNANGATINVTYPYGGTAQALTTSYATYCYLGAVDESKKAYLQLTIKDGVNEQTVSLKNFMALDLTTMFGAGKEPTTVDEFKALFPLPYYAYDTGSLLDFTGTKLKTTGKNLSDKSSITCSATGYINASNSVLTKVFKGNTYTISFDNLTTLSAYIIVRVTPDGASYNVDQTKKTLTASKRCDITFTATDTGNLWLSGQATGYSSVKVFDNIQVEFGSTPSVYEAYESNETDLPISTFFPTGMKSAGAVYDELTPTRAITRVGQVDLGSLTWTATTNNRYITTGVASVIKAPVNNQTVANIVCEKYPAVTYSDIVDNSALGIAINGSSANKGNVCIRDTGTYADAAAFKTAMSGVMLNYELAVEDVQPTMSFDSE